MPLCAFRVESAPGRPAARSPAARPGCEQVRAAQAPLPLHSAPALPRSGTFAPRGPRTPSSSSVIPPPSRVLHRRRAGQGQRRPASRFQNEAPSYCCSFRARQSDSLSPLPLPPISGIVLGASDPCIPQGATSLPSPCQREDQGLGRHCGRRDPEGTCLPTSKADGRAYADREGDAGGSLGAGYRSPHGALGVGWRCAGCVGDRARLECPPVVTHLGLLIRASSLGFPRRRGAGVLMPGLHWSRRKRPKGAVGRKAPAFPGCLGPVQDPCRLP